MPSPPRPAPDTSGLYGDCTLCDDFPRPVFDPNSALVDIEAHLTELIAQARLSSPTPFGDTSIIVLVPGALRGYELHMVELGPRRDLILAALGRYKP
jgi:hypothetical protein